mmetsp:Transcript_107725/g.303480  ORF Transcript_107725/g.303480 Transcript_107725/m.303480 type:complete len:246 (-) Transcript_107725:628-1365(-)
MFGHEAGAVNICARTEDITHGFLSRGSVVVRSEDVFVGIAIARDVAIEAPVLAGHSVEEPPIGARRYAIHGIVTAHKRCHTAFFDARLERAHVTVHEISHGYHCVHMMPILVLTVWLRCGLQFVGHVVLATSAGLNMVRVLGCLLESLHEVLGIFCGNVWILPRRLDVAPPPRLPSQVDDRSPERGVPVASVHHRACLTTNLSADQLPQSPIEAHARSDGERELGCLRVPPRADARRRLRPPVVG